MEHQLRTAAPPRRRGPTGRIDRNPGSGYNTLMSFLRRSAEELLKKLKTACKKFYGDDLVCLAVFGSVARNTQTFQSDIDVLLIVSGLPDGRMNRIDRFTTIEAELLPAMEQVRENGWNVELSPVIRTPEEVRGGGYFYLDMVDDALILYDKDGFFANYLQELKKRLNEYGAQKKRWKGGYYWDVKPDHKPGEVIRI